MSWIRHLAPRPTDYNPGQLQAEAGAVAVNVVGDELAGYWVPGEEPTEAEWQAVVSAHVPVAPPPSPLELLASLSPAELQRVITLGVMVTEPAAVTTLETAVAEGDAVQGVAVVADAASAAQASVE